MIAQVKHVSIPIKDQDVALKFYTEKLGFEVAVDAEFAPDQQRWIELKIPGADTQIVLFTNEGQEDRIGTFSNIIFYSDDVQKTTDELKAKGVEFTQDPVTETWGSYSVFKDPDGNTFMISSS